MPMGLRRFVLSAVAVAAVATGSHAVLAAPAIEPMAGSPTSVTPSATLTSGTKAVFVPVTQKRVLATTTVSPTSPRKVTVAGVAGVPTDAVAVVVNVAAVKPAKAGFLVAYPAGTTRPSTVYTLTYAAGQVDESIATVKVGTLRQITIYVSTATPVVVDVAGYYVNHNHDDAYLPKAAAQGRSALNALTCPTGSLIRSVAADGATTCVQDATGPVAGVGSGLLLDNGVLNAEQGRSAANAFTCPAGQYLRSVAANGAPTCATDATGGGTSFVVGDGLDLVDGVLSAEQGRSAVNAFACPTGSYLRNVAKDGTPTCNTDKDTTYSAGVGLLLTDGVFSAEQGRSAANAFTCPAGQYLQAVAANGAPTCAADRDTDTNTTYSAGFGLMLLNGTFSAEQGRSAANAFSCPAGQYLQAASATGAPTCAADKDTTYAAGAGLALANGTFTAEQRRSVVNAFTCPPGQYLRVVAADGTPTCAVDTDTNTTYTAGSGLLLNNGVFSAEQGRSAANAFTCPTGQYLQQVAANGAPTCAADRDTDTNTTYEAGVGLLLEGNVFSAEQSRTAKFPFYCESGTFMREVANDGFTTCDADQTGPSYSAGFGLLLTNGVFSAQQGRSAANAFTCGLGEFLRSVASDGTPTCAIDKDTTYTAGSGISISGNTISAQQSRTAANAFSCPTGQALRVVGADGAPTCIVATYTAGNGLALNGTTFSSAYGATVVPIRADATPAENGTLLRNAMAAVTGATAEKPYVLALAPGTYELGASSLTMKPYVSVVGAGRGFTTITGARVSQSGGLVNLGDQTTLSGVTVRNMVPAGTSFVTAIMSNGANTARLVDVHGYASQEGGETYGLLAFAGGNISVENSQFTVVNPTAIGTGIYSISNTTVRARNVEVGHAAVGGWALHSYNASRIEFSDGYANGAVRKGTPDATLHLTHSKVDGIVNGGVQCFSAYTSAMAAATCT